MKISYAIRTLGTIDLATNVASIIIEQDDNKERIALAKRIYGLGEIIIKKTGIKITESLKSRVMEYQGQLYVDKSDFNMLVTINVVLVGLGVLRVSKKKLPLVDALVDLIVELIDTYDSGRKYEDIYIEAYNRYECWSNGIEYKKP